MEFTIGDKNYIFESADDHMRALNEEAELSVK